MQEIVLILSSVAGACTAAVIRKFPKNKSAFVRMGGNLHIKSQLDSLRIEKEILTKTISRLYQQDSGLSKIQRDRLLTRYQHQLGIVLAKIEKLEEANKHPDLGPLGDGLITIMDQKLSQIDHKLSELSSKISSATVNGQPKQKASELVTMPKAEKIEPQQIRKEVTKTHEPIPAIKVENRPRAVEITTLTELPNKMSEFHAINERASTDLIQDKIERPQMNVDEKIEILQASIGSTLSKPEIIQDAPKAEPIPEPSKPKPVINLPKEEDIDDDDEDDLKKIRDEMMKTLSKLEQAEVE